MKLPGLNNPKWKVLFQFIQNTLAYALPVFFQQFIIYPLMAKKLGAEANGHFLAVIALNYFIINITATVLVNVRLLKGKNYEEQKIKGDFNLFLLAFAVISTAVVIGGSIFYGGGTVNLPDLLLSVAVVLLFLYHDYITVQYRAELRFTNILINNLIICGGYLVGLAVLYFVLPCWQMVFIVPYLMTMVYDLGHTNYIREPLRITPLFSDTAKQYFLLLGSSLLSTVVTYGDRLILYPLMDGASVSVFSSAQLVGKILQMISTPLSSFILAYLVRNKATQLKLRASFGLLGVGACLVLYFGCLLVSGPMIRFLYPDWASQSLQYVSLTAANGVLHMVNVLLNVLALRFCHAKWQVVKGVLYMVSYLLLSFLLLHFFDLRGFCVGNILASVTELVFFAVLLFKKKVIVFTGGTPRKA